MKSPAIIVVSLIAFTVSVIFHEFCHALAGHLLGDDTAKRYGRLTLNPLPHIDTLGTVILPIIGALTSLPVIGWAKPVPFNPYNLKYGKWGAVLVALAGPTSNIVVAATSVLALRVLVGSLGLGPNNLLAVFLVLLVVISVVLAVFNLLPVNPLDGSRLVSALLDAPKYDKTRAFLETKGPILILIIILLSSFGPVPFLGNMYTYVIVGFFKLFGALPVLSSIVPVM